MRSKDALCGLMIGDQASWEGSVRESHEGPKSRSSSRPRRTIRWRGNSRRPPGNWPRPSRNSFPGSKAPISTRASARESCRPASTPRPGLTTTTPGPTPCRSTSRSVTNAAAQTARDMQESQIVQPVNDGSGKQAGPGKGGAGPIRKAIERFHGRGHQGSPPRQGRQAGAEREDQPRVTSARVPLRLNWHDDHILRRTCK